MGSAAARTCLRGRLRPHGRRPVPAHCTVSALAPRSRARVVHVRPTRQAGQLRSRERVQRRLEQSFEIVVEVASARERRQSLARSPDGDGVIKTAGDDILRFARVPVEGDGNRRVCATTSVRWAARFRRKRIEKRGNVTRNVGSSRPTSARQGDGAGRTSARCQRFRAPSTSRRHRACRRPTTFALLSELRRTAHPTPSNPRVPPLGQGAAEPVP